MCLSNIKDGTAGQPFVMVGKHTSTHQKKHLHSCRCFFRYRGEWQFAIIRFIASHQRCQKKKRPFSNGRHQKSQTRIAFTKKHNHLEHLQYSTPPSNKHNTRIEYFYSYLFCGNFRPPLQRKLPTHLLGTALTVPNVCYYLSIRREERKRKNAKFPYRYREKRHFQW